MFKIVSLSLAAVALLASMMTQANDRFKEGEHYTVLPLEKSAKPSITKLFSFYCGACYAIEPYMQALEPKLPETVSVRKIHVDFVRGASPEILASLGKASILAKQQGKGPEFHSQVFRQIHQSKVPFRSEKDVVIALMSAGVNQDVAEKGLNSFAISAQQAQGKILQDELANARHIQGVPTLIVNNKYKIEHGALDKGNFQNELLDLTNHLLSL